MTWFIVQTVTDDDRQRRYWRKGKLVELRTEATCIETPSAGRRMLRLAQEKLPGVALEMVPWGKESTGKRWDLGKFCAVPRPKPWG